MAGGFLRDGKKFWETSATQFPFKSLLCALSEAKVQRGSERSGESPP